MSEERKGPIWDAITKVCGELPEGYEIRLHMENGAGCVEWTAPNGDVELIDGCGYISDDIMDAFDAAVKHSEEA